MQRLLRDVRRGDVLVVARPDRLSRSLSDFAALMERAQAKRWNVVALDLGIDLATPNGEFMASALAAMASWERRIIGQRAREGMAAARAKAAAQASLRAPARGAGPPAHDRANGLSLRTIADRLTAEGVPTATGRTVWRASTVHAAIRSTELEREPKCAAT